MPTPWITSIRTNRLLTVFPTPAVTQGPWDGVFTRALEEFNRLSLTMRLGVTMIRAIVPPDPSSVTKGANVQFDAASGTVHEVVMTNRFGHPLHDFTLQVQGDAMHGHTQPAQWETAPGVREQFRAYVFVPSTPQIMTGPAGQQKRRDVGDGVKLFIAVHELIHVCGLSNADHSPGAEPDFFVGQPQPSSGPDAGRDKLAIRIAPTVKLPFDPPQAPLFLTERTARLIRSVW